MTLLELEQQIKQCCKCGLCSTRTNLVFGDGNENADLVFVGEAPGKNEDLQGKPFVGAAGKLLTQLLESIGLKRNQVYIANILKCRPPNNRDPLPDEIKVCKPILFKQLEIIKPKIIVTLGAHSTRVMLDEPVSISAVRGKIFEVDSFKIFPIFHPAAALYNRNNITSLEEDFQKLKTLLRETKKPEEKTEQEKLF